MTLRDSSSTQSVWCDCDICGATMEIGLGPTSNLKSVIEICFELDSKGWIIDDDDRVICPRCQNDEHEERGDGE